MLLILSAGSLLLSFLLLYFNAKKYPSSVYLGLFFLLSSVYSFIQYLLLYSQSANLIAVFYLNTAFISYLIGPMLYFYVRSLFTDISGFRKRDLWHFLPALIVLIASLNHLVSPWSQKIQTAMQIIGDRSYVWKDNFILTNYYYPKYLNFLSRPVIILIYSISSFNLLIRFSKEKNKDVHTKPGQNLKWLTLLLTMVAVIALSQSILILWSRLIQSIDVFYSVNSLQIISVIAMLILILSPFFNPEILYGFPQTPVSMKPIESGESTHHIDIQHNTTHKSGFESNYLAMIEEKILDCMKNEQPYLQSECNIASLSKLIDVPAHHLSFYFREVKKQSFNDFRNEWRVRHAAKLFAEGKANEFTIEAIGLMSGFSSRNTFFIAFKKFMGVSPGSFASEE